MSDETATTATNPDGGTGTTAVDAATTTPVVEKGPEVVETKAANTATEPKVEETKGKETSEQDGKPTVPEVYEFKAPEGITLDEGAIAIVSPVLKGLGITQEGAQKLADSFIQIQAAQAAAQSEAWLTDLKADPEIGGKNHEVSKQLAQEAFAKWGTPALKTFLEATGLGNHPELNRVFVKIAKASAQDTHVPAEGGGVVETSPAKRMFPEMK